MKLLAGLLFTVALALPAAAATDTQTKDLTAEELGKLLEQKDKVFFLDVRSPAEIESLGSVKGYVNIPLDQLEGRLNEVPKDKLIVTL
jgi:rhodanese-related sulfurtransferase